MIAQDTRVWEGSTVARAIFAWFVLLFSSAIAVSNYLFTIPRGGDEWASGDWLINFGGGFVRRGLFGQLMLDLFPNGDEGGLWWLFGIQMLCYGLVLAFSLGVLHRARYSWSSIALVCGPAALAFNGWGKMEGSFKKELLAFAALVLLGWAVLRHRRAITSAVLTTLSLAVFVLAMFSWEASIFMLPAFGYLLLAAANPDPRMQLFRRIVAALFLSSSAVIFLVSSAAHGDRATALELCQSLRDNGYGNPWMCDGAIRDGIAWSTEQTLHEVEISFPYFAGYFPLIILSLLPAVASRWFRRNWLWGALICLGILPLYLVVTDYGRWTYMIVISLMVCITAIDANDCESPLWTPLAAVMYVSLWGIPHFMTAVSEPWAFRGLLAKVIEYTTALFPVPHGKP